MIDFPEIGAFPSFVYCLNIFANVSWALIMLPTAPTWSYQQPGLVLAVERGAEPGDTVLLGKGGGSGPSLTPGIQDPEPQGSSASRGRRNIQVWFMGS